MQTGRAPAGEVWHFSEDPHISRFLPHLAPTSTHEGAYVWACKPERCPDYWCGRQTPRAMAWRVPGCDEAEADGLLGRGVQRLHVIEHDSLASMEQARLFAYRFDAAGFHELEGFAMVAETEQIPLGPPLALPSPWELHRQAGIPVMVVANLFDWWSQIIHTDLGFSGIRLKNSPNYARFAASLT